MREYNAMFRLHADIAESLGPTTAALWSSHLFAIAAPSTHLLATGMFERPTGVLSALDRVGASLTWLDCGLDEMSTITAATLTTKSEITQVPPTAQRLVIRCDVRCSICEDPMLVEDRDLHWESESEVVVALGVVPICPRCTQCAEEEPAYWSEHLRHLTRPTLKLVEGGGKSDGKPAGILRVVENEEDEGDE